MEKRLPDLFLHKPFLKKYIIKMHVCDKSKPPSTAGRLLALSIQKKHPKVSQLSIDWRTYFLFLKKHRQGNASIRWRETYIDQTTKKNLHAIAHWCRKNLYPSSARQRSLVNDASLQHRLLLISLDIIGNGLGKNLASD